ncbi:AraC family transcriptional regulator [Oleiagrimonas sp. C23AA]|nr:AraC family transcriptional regulator [Oleiagrimonas sp. C23AA]
MHDDPLSHLLRLAQIESVVSGGFSTGGQWAMRFPAPDKVKFFVAIRGSCCFHFDDDPQPLHLASGDVVLLAAPRGFIVGNHATEHPTPAREAFAGRPGAIVHVGSKTEQEQMFLGGHVRLASTYGHLLSEALPPYIHVQSRTNLPQATALSWVLDQLVHEHEALPGAGLARSQLAHLLFVQVLRAHLAAGGTLPAGWLRAATDARLAPALRGMHEAPQHPWRLQELAQRCAMSRTRFAALFREVAGQTPLAYLTAWRMQLAARALDEENASVAQLAQQLGYGSESAFSHAFKRATGKSPRHYARALNGQGVASSA